MEYQETIKQMLNDLLQKTIEKKISWTSVNANAIRWVKEENVLQKTMVTLQKQPSSVPTIRENYILTIQPPIPSPATQIQTSTDQSFRDVLAQLFNEANKESLRIANERKIESIKNLLKGL